MKHKAKCGCGDSSCAPFHLVQEGVCAPQGFHAAGIRAGIKKTGKKDLGLIVSESPCVAAGTFTINEMKAAPVLYDLQAIRRGSVGGVVVNSGNANACTGAQGLRDAKQMALLAARAAKAAGFGAAGSNFMVASTGRIGIHLPMSKIAAGIRVAGRSLSTRGKDVTEAIMTTDTFPKSVAVEFAAGGKTVRIGGIAKGAGMIEPGMSPSGRRPELHATMLCFVTTDAALPKAVLQRCLNQAVAQSFNRITVDGDMSTNDTVLLLANGRAGNRPLKGGEGLQRFQYALDQVLLALALAIVRDGEGVSKMVTVEVEGAATTADAELAARAIANSTLVKCSWYGGDANWGRLGDAVGYSGAKASPERFSVWYDEVMLVKNGRPIHTREKAARRVLQKREFLVRCALGMGKGRACVYTADLTEKYVRFNKGE